MSRIDRDGIVEAALQLLDERGLVGVTTRRVAERLGVKSSSLYWHIRNRDELMDLLADRIVADARWPEATAGWRQQVEALMHEYLRCLMAHRDAAQVAAGRPPTGPNRLRGAEMMLTALVAAGLSEQQAVDATLVLTTYVVGFALEQSAAARVGEAEPTDRSHLSPQQYPMLVRLAELVRPPGPANRFEQGLALVLDGIESKLASSRVAGGERRARRRTSSALAPRYGGSAN